jgi:two-component system phosphate regulon sensor histidine kinase PhoR
MIGRWFGFTAFLLVGGGLGFWASRDFGGAAGMLVGGFAWLAIDSFYVVRLLRWLRLEQGHETPSLSAIPMPALPGVWGRVSDRTRRILKNRDRHLQDSLSRLDEFLAAIQASPSGVVLLDAQGRIEWCNQIATQHFGFDAQRDVMQHILNLVREPAFKSYMVLGDFAHDVVIPGNRSTPARPVKLSVHVHGYGQNRQLLLSRDITAVELAEAMRRDFVANVSHEIRTPLTVLSGFIETLQTLPLKEAERVRYLALMGQQSVRMQSLVVDLLTLSRLEGSPFPNSPGANDWMTVKALLVQCEQEARALSALITPQVRKLSFDMGPPSELAGVQTELFSAFSNLVTNAVRYTPESGSVHVQWRLLPDGRGQFLVKDTGQGIAAEHLPRLTERFYRVDRSRSRETGGTGLGLAIVKHVAQRHGAELHIVSTPGQGSCFCITFPAARVRSVPHSWHASADSNSGHSGALAAVNRPQ